jgi:hypothetical protein
MRVRNIVLAVAGAAVLVLSGSYSGPWEQVVHSYSGNVAVTFALYFAVVSSTHRLGRRSRLVAALATLAVVTAFELTSGFGLTANVYDPLDLLANGAGVGLAVVVDVLSSRLLMRTGPEDSPVA